MLADSMSRDSAFYDNSNTFNDHRFHRSDKREEDAAHLSEHDFTGMKSENVI